MPPTPPRHIFTFHSAGSLIFGRGAVDQIGQVIKRCNYRRALLITDPILIEAGLANKVIDSLTRSSVESQTFSGGEPEPSMNAVLACVDQARPFRADALIALGGGSNMDLAKMAAVLLVHGGHPRDYLGDGKVPGPVAPLVCLPTTAGTGSEVSFATVLKDTEKGIKAGCLSNYLRPAVAIVDPLLTVSCPPATTADSGIDALTHAIESYTAVDNESFPLPDGDVSVYQGRHPLGNCLAEKAIELIGRHLRRAVANGDDVEAREGMALGATIAGLAFSNVGVAAVHALEYPIGSATGAPHGRGNGLLLPYVMRFNLAHRKPEFRRIAQLLGEDVSRADDENAAERAIDAVEKLRRDIGIPHRLRDLGAERSQLRGYAETAHGIQRVLRVNPRTATIDQLEEILTTAY